MPEKKISIDSKFELINPLNKEIMLFCLENNIPDSEYGNIEICLTEALNNVIEHSYKEKEGEVIEVIVLIENNMLELQINDYGISRTNLDTPKLEFDPDDIQNLPEGGMGLFIISKLMDEIEYKISGNKNIFLMRKFLN